MPDGGKDNWFSTWYKKGGKKFLRQDTRTDEGRDNVANFLLLKDPWTNVKEAHDDTTTTSKKIYDLLNLIAKSSPKRQICFGFIEGMHRCNATLWALVQGRIGTNTGSLKQGSLTKHDMVRIGRLEGDGEVNDDQWRDLVDDSSMLNAVITMKVDYVNDSKTNVPELLDMMRTRSKTHSDNKIDSARPDALYSLGEILRVFCRSMTIDHMKNEPVREDILCAPNTRPNGKEAKKEFDEAMSGLHGLETIEDAMDRKWAVCELLSHKDYVAYMGEPFNEEYDNRVRELLALPQDGKKGSMLQVPFKISFNTIAKAVGENPTTAAFLTGDKANDFYITPKILHCIYGGMRNQTMRQIARNEDLLNIIGYAVRFHRGPNVGTAKGWSVHPSSKLVYKLGCNSKYLCESPSSQSNDACLLIAAGCLVADMLLSSIAMNCDAGQTHEESLQNVHRAGDELQYLFRAMHDQAKYAPMKEIIKHLGKYKLA